MNIKNFGKYILRFLSLQTVLTVITIFYFDNYLVWSPTFKEEIYYSLLQDKNKFLPFISDSFISVDGVLATLIFFFLVVLYSTNFYTYVNELSYSLNRNLIGEYFQIFLLWTSYLLVSLFVLRFNNLYRSSLLVFCLLIPLILLIFRNTEFISSLLGRSMTSENFISINFDESSKFRNLRIMTFRKNKGAFYINENNFDNELIEVIDTQNKKNKINLVVIETNKTRLSDKVEEYLINLNKKVLIISKNDFSFKNVFIYRSEKLDNNKLTYFNNDIQYGSKFILKRSLDILLSLCLILFFSPIILFIYALIYIKDRSPVIIKQDRVGLHGEQFNMYKFRTMRNNSHNLRDDLSSLNKRSGPLFKIENDPRIIKGLSFIRTYSLDEIPQLINVLKGQMSLVGPRPLFDNDTDSFDRHYMRRLNVMPGITGLLQINERNTSDFSIWYKYDIEYIENWSLFLDLQIILKTPFAMFSKKIKGL